MEPTVRLSRGMLFVALGWLATMALTFWLLTLARQHVIASLSTPEAQGQWQRWQQEEAERQADPTSSVRRRAPKSPEPPALVLMRDSFSAIVGAMFVVATLCFAFAVMSLSGILPKR
jgi:hypothetical protein